MTANPTPAELAQRIAELPEPIGLIVGRRSTPAGTREFWGYFADSYDGDKKERAYSADQVIAAQDKHAAPLIERIKELERQLAEANVREAKDYNELLDAMNEVKAENVRLTLKGAELERRNAGLVETILETRRAIADDSYAATFQSLGQYRTALLKLLPAALARSNGQSEKANGGV
jgi:SepF-like predicted cell division protein (DUF552 family)